MLSSTFRPIVHRARARRDAAYGRLGGIGCRSRCPIISSATEGGHHPLHSLYPITTRCVRARKDKASLTVPDVLDDGERRPRRCKLSSATTGNAVCGDWGDVRDRRGRPYTAATHHYSLEVPILSAPAHTGTQYILVSTTCSADAKPLEFRSRRYPPCPCPRSRKPHMSSAADDWFVAGFDEAASKWLGGSASQTSWRMDFLARAWCGRWRASQSRVGGGYGCRVGGALACASSVRVSLERECSSLRRSFSLTKRELVPSATSTVRLHPRVECRNAPRLDSMPRLAPHRGIHWASRSRVSGAYHCRVDGLWASLRAPALYDIYGTARFVLSPMTRPLLVYPARVLMNERVSEVAWQGIQSIAGSSSR